MMMKIIISRIANRFLNPLPMMSYCEPFAVVPNSGTNFDLEELLNGYLWATPKRRTPWRKKMHIKYGNANWKDGTKLWKSKRNIITCMECGSFHEFHAICRNCFTKVQEESEKIIRDLRATWAGKAIDKEVQVLYEGEKVESAVANKRIVELERPRPLWFAPNLSQITANPAKKISGPSVPSDMLEAKLKDLE